MLKKAFSICLLLLGALFAGLSIAADEPTLQLVYQAAEAGRLTEAQSMMATVLRNHPDSGKAHFVEAELLAKQGRVAGAAAELSTAQRLAPGLPFAKPQAVENLQQRIASSKSSAQLIPSAHQAQFGPASGIPWGMLLTALGLIAAVAFFVRSMSQRNSAALSPAGGPAYGTGFGSGTPVQPYGAGGAAVPMAPTAGGIGSGILGGLATGAALGAGMVAGEALMHRFTDGNRLQSGPVPPATSTDWDATPDDMGGSDFGVSDSSSWDDSSGGGDWN